MFISCENIYKHKQADRHVYSSFFKKASGYGCEKLVESLSQPLLPIRLDTKHTGYIQVSYLYFLSSTNDFLVLASK